MLSLIFCCQMLMNVHHALMQSWVVLNPIQPLMRSYYYLQFVCTTVMSLLCIFFLVYTSRSCILCKCVLSCTGPNRQLKLWNIQPGKRTRKICLLIMTNYIMNNCNFQRNKICLPSFLVFLYAFYNKFLTFLILQWNTLHRVIAF